jgi:hypothetical protein
MKDASCNQAAQLPRRPLVLGVVSIVGFILALLWMPLPEAWHFGFGYGLHMLLSSLVGMVCMYGFWKMWRWSVVLYAGFVLCR